jgi:hypothetical protein
MDEATAKAWRAEPCSKVTLDIEDIGQGVAKLTVTHDGFPPGSRVLQAISEGWPAVLSSLKPSLRPGRPCLPPRLRTAHAGLSQATTNQRARTDNPRLIPVLLDSVVL